jgi:hypothetical protein
MAAASNSFVRFAERAGAFLDDIGNRVTDAVLRYNYPSGAPATLRATEGLLYFCRQRDPANYRNKLLADIAELLRTARYRKAMVAWKKLYFGKEGFGDWWPDPLKDEPVDYAQAVFDGLSERWHRLMTLMENGTFI